MPASSSRQAWSVQSEEDRAMVQRQLERMVQHQHFKSSRRYCEFLRFVVEESLNGNAEQLKERTIGFSVFNQLPSYDTSSNSIVRVAAGEVRKRIAQYYRHAIPEDEVFIELPVGSYAPQFYLCETVATAIGPIPSLSVPPDVLPPEELELVSASAPQQAEERPRTWARSAWLIFAAVATASVVIMLLIRRPSNPADRIWQTMVSDQPVTICLGAVMKDGSTEPEKDAPGQNSSPGSHSILLLDVPLMATVSAAVGHAGGNVRVLDMLHANFSDLQQSPSVLLGAFNNRWTLHLQTPLRYQFAKLTNAETYEIVDTRNPTSKVYIVDANKPYDKFTQDYGLVAHFLSPTTGKWTMIIAGVSANGTEAAGDVLTNQSLLQTISARSPRNWEEKNFEILVATQVIDGQNGPPKILDTFFW
jgi:hypothetical protein